MRAKDGGLSDGGPCGPWLDRSFGSSVLFFALLVIVVFLMITISSISFLGGIRIALPSHLPLHNGMYMYLVDRAP
jgi:hypothetical protein